MDDLAILQEVTQSSVDMAMFINRTFQNDSCFKADGRCELSFGRPVLARYDIVRSLLRMIIPEDVIYSLDNGGECFVLKVKKR